MAAGSAPPPESKTVAEVMVQALVDAGATHVFGGHGGAVVPLIKAIVAHPDIEWVYTRHEGSASLAAAAAAKLKAGSGIGVCLATSGPGATNLTTGLVSAAKDNLPVVALTGLKPSYKSGLTDFQDIEAARLFAGVLSFSHRVMHPIQAPQLMRDAVAAAICQRTAVHISIPEDIQSSLLDPEHHLPIRSDMLGMIPRLSSCGEEAMGQTVEYLRRTARHSRIVIGVGLLAVNAGPQVTALAEQLDAPMVTRLDAKGTIDEDHPLSLGVVGVHGNPGLEISRDMLESADCVISVGVQDQMLGQLVLNEGMQTKDLIIIHPDLTGVSGRFRISSTLIGNIPSTLEKLTAALRQTSAGSKGAQEVAERRSTDSAGGQDSFPISLAWEHIKAGGWRHDKRPLNQESRFEVERQADAEASEFCHPSDVYAELNGLLGPRDTLCVDVGDQTLWAAMLGHLRKGTRTLSDEFMGTMGYSLPAAIAASLLQPDGVHVAVAGDGAFQMTLNELATAVQNNCRVVAIVFCNGSLGRVKYGFGSDAIDGTNIANPDFVLMAQAVGAKGAYASSPEEAKKAVLEAWNDTGVYVVQVALDPNLSAKMAKVRDVHDISALARRLGDALPESMAQLRRPQALEALLTHYRHTRDLGQGTTLSDASVAELRSLLLSWRESYGGAGGGLSHTDSGLTRFMMQQIHRMGSTCGCCWTPLNKDGTDMDEQGQPLPPVKMDTGSTVTDSALSDFPGAYPAEFLERTSGLSVSGGFAARWLQAVRHLMAAKPGGPEQLEEFLSTGQSRGRSMSWVVMTIQPDQSFPLHAHPNIEAIYVAKGTLHELRMSGPPPVGDLQTDGHGHPLGPDLSDCRATFDRSALAEGSFLVNEVGSVHQSFTEGEGCVLLVLWGGSHANIPTSKLPKNPVQAGFMPVELLGSSD